MASQNLRYCTLSEVAKLLLKSEEEILKLVESCTLLALCWYDGVGFEVGKPPHATEGCLYSGYDIVWRGWVFVVGGDVAVLRAKGEMLLERLVPFQDRESYERLRSFDPLIGDLELVPSFYPAFEAQRGEKLCWKKGRHTITKADLMFSPKEIERFRPEQLLPSGGKLLTKKGGRPTEYLSQAVEKAAIYFLNNGNTEILLPGNIRSFIKGIDRLRENEEKAEQGTELWKVARYLSKRIKKVSLPPKKSYSIVVHERWDGDKMLKKETEYPQDDVAQILSRMREKKLIP